VAGGRRHGRRELLTQPLRAAWPTSASGAITSGVLFLIVSIFIGGLIVGALGRLVVPGRQPMGCLGTAVVGVAGAVIGGAIARGIYINPARHLLVTLILEVAVAAVIVALVSRR